MKPLKDVFFPADYTDELSKLKDKYFAWKMDFSSKTDVANMGHITHYEIRDTESRGNLVLVPGLASNTQIEPLMCAVTYWSLKHRYNIYALDSFLGDFQEKISDDAAKRNTLPEFIDLMDAGLEIVSKMSVGKWTCVIGHSLGGTGVLEVFNRRIMQNKPMGYSGAILFASFLTKDWFDATKRALKRRQYPEVSPEDFYNCPIGLGSPHDVSDNTGVRYVSVYPGFYDDLDKLKPRPDLMAQYDIPVTLVAGGLDKKSPIEYMRGIYNQVQEYPGEKKMRFVEFPNSKHSFINQHKNWNAILRLIQSQHTHSPKHKTK